MLEENQEAAGPHSDRPQSRLWRYAPLIFWMAAIFFASTGELSASNTALLIEPLIRWFMPHVANEHIVFLHLLVRKAGHLSEYAILGWLAARAFGTSTHPHLRRRWFMASLILICVYAFSDEYHQSFVPSRTASIYDSMIDICGGLTGLGLTALWKTRRRRRQKRTAAVDSPWPTLEH